MHMDRLLSISKLSGEPGVIGTRYIDVVNWIGLPSDANFNF